MKQPWGRPGPEFPTEDAASRWLYQELATAVADVRGLGAEEEQYAAEKTAELLDSVRERLDGRIGATTRVTLEPGHVVDAFGPESGSLLFPDGTPFDRRGLPESLRDGPGGSPVENYRRYLVTYPFQVEASLVAAADGGQTGVRFGIGSEGFATPQELPSIRALVGGGYLERVTAPEVPD